MHRQQPVVVVLTDLKNTAASVVVRAVSRWAFAEGADWQQIRRRHTLLTVLPGAPRGITVTSTHLGGVRTEKLTPSRTESDLVMLYLHGGGFVTGSPRTHRALAGLLAKHLGATCYALDYRLAPEHPYPAAVIDVQVAYQALLDDGIRSENIVVVGDSAGANLAIGLAMTARDRGIPLPSAVGLICPGLDLTDAAHRAMPQATRDAVLTKPLLRRFLDAYATGEHCLDPTASPLHADLSGLPPLVVEAAECDLLVGQARLLVTNAFAAGIDVTYREHRRMWHDFHVMAGLFPMADKAIEEFAEQLTQARDNRRRSAHRVSA